MLTALIRFRLVIRFTGALLALVLLAAPAIAAEEAGKDPDALRSINQLPIYIPPLHEQESSTRRAVSTASTGRSRTVNSFGGTTIRRSGR